MAKALENRACSDDILIGDTPKARRRKGRIKHMRTPGRLWKHSTLQDIEGSVDPTQFFIFTLVRNPWDRMVSYYHWLQAQTFAHPAVALAQSTDFKDFLRHDQTQTSLRREPYTSFLKDLSGVDHCALYARLEYPSDLGPLWKHLGFTLTVPTVNTSARNRDWRVYYDTETAEIIQKIAGDDIARFGYAFDP